MDRVRSGSALILVVSSVAVACVVGLIFLSASTTITRVAQTLDHHAQARQVAESCVDMSIRYLEDNADWRAERESGMWLENFRMLDGTCDLSVEFTTEPAIDKFIVADSSFEQETRELETPFLNPPMFGQIGGWRVERTAKLESGATVPLIGTRASTTATDGGNIGFIGFEASVDGTALFRQSLNRVLKPHHSYEVSVHMQTSGLPLFDRSFGIRVLAETEVVATTNDATVLLLPSDPGDVEEILAKPPLEPTSLEEAVVELLVLENGFVQYTLRFTTDGTPLTGELVLELFAESQFGVTTSIGFDDARLHEESYEPFTLAAVGHRAGASHVVTATVTAVPEVDGRSAVRIVHWDEH